MRRVEWEYNLDKLKNALEEYIQCLKPYYSKEGIKIEVAEVVDSVLETA